MSKLKAEQCGAIEFLPGLVSLALWRCFADTDEDGIAYTDGSVIYAGAKYAEVDAKKRRFICLHEILHVALCHPRRAAQLEPRDADFNAELLNIAADAIINSEFDRSGIYERRSSVVRGALLFSQGANPGAGESSCLIAAYRKEALGGGLRNVGGAIDGVADKFKNDCRFFAALSAGTFSKTRR